MFRDSNRCKKINPKHLDECKGDHRGGTISMRGQPQLNENLNIARQTSVWHRQKKLK